jgi:ribosomal protein RSM22 (predicted rRNA methylase)
MNRTLQNLVQKDLCPDGIWLLTDVMQSVLRYQISRLPKIKVTETDSHYPNAHASMREFLEIFFSRHYFQIQSSLINYMVSQDFLNIIRFGNLRILDIGSGPAVASLAITDVLVCILKHLKNLHDWPKGKVVNVTYVLNDTSGICLGTGQRMLTDYFQMKRGHKTGIVHGRTIGVQNTFPTNMNQIQWIARNSGTYGIVTLSYVIVPLNEDGGLNNIVNGLLNIEKLCNRSGRILIVQDRFNASLMRRIGMALGISIHKEELTQQIYPKRDTNETYTYSYYSCLYAPSKEVVAKQSTVA